MEIRKKLFDDLSTVSEKYNCTINLPVKIKNGKLTYEFNDIGIIYTNEDQTKDILYDLKTILDEIDPENKEFDILITVILDNGEKIKLTAMFGK